MGLSDLSDAELVYRLREGQQQALSVLYERYAGLVYTIAYKILSNRQEAEDLSQDIFVTFWKHNSFDPNRGSLSTFLGLLTRSRAIDKQRSRNTTQNFLIRWQKLTSEEASELLPLEQASLEERQEKLRQALRELPELQCRILEMNYLEGLSQSQIAQALNLTLGTVKSRSRQGLLQLKKLLLEKYY
jgi:RNA polymerase sigma-70 factor (ECF subfamily)